MALRFEDTGPRAAEQILRPNETCWRLEHAGRVAVIVDAAEFFKAVKASILKARHSVMFIAWDFDTGIELEPKGRTLEGPNRLGRFLSWIVEKRPELNIQILKWELGALQSLVRGATPLFIVDWMTNRRIRFKVDANHPFGAAHHQKIVVIDDAIAFCGGIDMTSGRWDTRTHREKDRHRKSRFGRHYKPWHDATAAADGAAARAIGELARERWFRATGERLEAPPASNDAWPDDLAPTFQNVNVAIARTLPQMENQTEVREVEALYLEAIRSARRILYIETQYLASRRLARALAARLYEPDAPEIVLILPKTSDGWLEEVTMDSARNRLLTLIHTADRYGRFRVYYPVAAGGAPIYVHAKIMIVDDRLLRIGSSNLNNRSTGFDTECDLALEGRLDKPSDEAVRARIVAVRNDLVAEHLNTGAAELAAELDSNGGSLIQAIEALRTPGRSLRVLPPRRNGPLDDMLAETDLVDPERPPRFWQRLKDKIRIRTPGRA